MRATWKPSVFAIVVEAVWGLVCSVFWTDVVFVLETAFFDGEVVAELAGTAEFAEADWVVPVEVAISFVMPAVSPSLFIGGSEPFHAGCVKRRIAPAIIPIAPILESRDLISGDIHRIYVVFTGYSTLNCSTKVRPW